MYKYLFYNPLDKEIQNFFAKIIVMNKDNNNVTIERTIKDSLKIRFCSTILMTSLKVSIGEVHFSNRRILNET
jgi:hypothetical protein